ncbi:MAG TPA: prephenate dehydratase [Acidimicrobiia bacterium]|nr:prephenate dehydratase [Acidimicrobiia bacterium]
MTPPARSSRVPRTSAAPPRVAFLGPSGTFTEQALLSQPDLAAGELTPIRSIAETIAAVDQGRAELGVVPIENAIEGSVNETLDTLAFEASEHLFIHREIVVPVDLNLCVKPGTKLADVKAVVSIPHASAQCRDWLAAKLPGIDVLASNSTAEAARDVARSRASGRAAIAPSLAAELYGLEVVAAGIHDHPDNSTRFVVIGHGIPARSGHDKSTLVVFQTHQDRPGGLLTILQEFNARGINLTKLESRPTKRELGSYCFFIDFEGHLSDELVADVLRSLAAKHEMRFLGSYAAAGREAGARRQAAGKAWREASRWVDGLRARVQMP